MPNLTCLGDLQYLQFLRILDYALFAVCIVIMLKASIYQLNMPPKRKSSAAPKGKEKKTKTQYVSADIVLLKAQKNRSIPSPSPEVQQLFEEQQKERKELKDLSPISMNVEEEEELSVFDYIDTDTMSTANKSSTRVSFTMAKKWPMTIQGQSNLGVCEGRTGGNKFIRLSQSWGAGFERYGHATSVSNVLYQVEKYSKAVALKVKPILVDMWGGKTNDDRIWVFKSGLNTAIKESRAGSSTGTLPPKIEVCLFPHNQWTKCYAMEKKAGQDFYTHPMLLSHMVQRTGNSKFVLNISINCTEIQYFKDRIEVTTYLNVNRLVWVNLGQDTSAPQLEEEEKARQAQIREDMALDKIKGLGDILMKDDRIQILSDGSHITVDEVEAAEGV